MQIREYLRSKGFQWQEKQRGNGTEAILNCPFCDDRQKKFAINLTTGAFNCFHENSCGVQGSWWDFQKMLGDEPRRLVIDSNLATTLKRTYKKPKVNLKKPEEPVIRYLKSRGFTEETIKRFNIGQKDCAVMIPYYKNGELVNVKYRGMRDKKMWNEKDAEPTLFNRDNFTMNELVITEGEFDCMALHQMGIQSVSVPNGANDFRWIETEWNWLERFSTIFICFDNDNAGRKGVGGLVNKLGAWRCRGVTLPFKDANECLKNGVAKDKIMDCFAGATEYPPSSLTSTADFIDDVTELIHSPERLAGTPTAWKRLDHFIRGWRMEELTIWSGQNGSGKSTILNQHILDLAKRGIKSCVASLEMPPARYLRWAVLQHTGKEYPECSEIRNALSWMDESIYVVNTHEEIKPGELLDIFEYAARRYNVKHFIIDSLMRVSFPGKEELKEHKTFVSDLLSFAKKFKCHMHLVAHPRKGAKDSDKPGKVDVMGTGHITNLAHNVLTMWRPGEEEKEAAQKNNKPISDAVLYIRKNREFGLEGGIKLYFDPKTKKFSDVYRQGHVPNP